MFSDVYGTMRYCDSCENKQCKQVAMDDTQGCCLCYNILILDGIYSGDVISACDDCYSYARIN